MLPSEFPEVRDCLKLRQLLARQMDMQVADLRVLLQLPRADLDAGCNFAMASVLFNLIGGCSICFMDADATRVAKHPRGGGASEFKKLLKNYYPWHQEPLRPSKGAEVLYHWARTPLVHALGLDEPDRDDMALAKGPISTDRILEIEESSARPIWLPATIDPVDEREGTLFVISVPTLYWGFHRMLHSLFSDPDQLSLSEQFSNAVRLAARSPQRKYRGV